MIDSIYPYKILENETIISNGEKEIRVSNATFRAKSNELDSKIRYQLGSPSSSLLSMNITYKIADSANNPISEHHLKEVNKIRTGHKYIKRIAKLNELGYQIDFDSYDDNTFKLNLQLIDSYLPEIVAHVILEKYVSKITKIKEVIEKIKADNPMGYDLAQGHKFYEYRLMNFLVEAALGRTSKTVWSEEYDTVGGILIVKPNTEMLCYHLNDFNKFRQYLKNSSCLDNPSGSKMGYGTVYKECGESFIKLNFQIKA